MRARVAAKNALETFAYQIRNSCDDPKMQESIGDEDKTRIMEAVDECTKWVDENPNAEQDEFESKQAELEEIWKPIMMAAYSQGQEMNGEEPPCEANDDMMDGPPVDEVD